MYESDDAYRSVVLKVSFLSGPMLAIFVMSRNLCHISFAQTSACAVFTTQHVPAIGLEWGSWQKTALLFLHNVMLPEQISSVSNV